MSTLNKFGVPVDTSGPGNGILMPKLKYRFRVTMVNFGGIGTTPVFTRQVETCSRPNLNHDSVELHSYNNVMYIPKKPTWDSVEIKLRDDIRSIASRDVASQLQRQMNHFDQTSGAAGADFKFQTLIEILDGSWQHEPLEWWALEGCYLEKASYDSHDYSSSDPVAITLTIRYDNAIQSSMVPYQNTVLPQFTNILAGK